MCLRTSVGVCVRACVCVCVCVLVCKAPIPLTWLCASERHQKEKDEADPAAAHQVETLSRYHCVTLPVFKDGKQDDIFTLIYCLNSPTVHIQIILLLTAASVFAKSKSQSAMRGRIKYCL